MGCKDVEKNPSVSCEYEYKQSGNRCEKWELFTKPLMNDFQATILKNPFFVTFINFSGDSDYIYNVEWDLGNVQNFLEDSANGFFSQFSQFQSKRNSFLKDVQKLKDEFQDLYESGDTSYEFDSALDSLEELEEVLEERILRTAIEDLDRNDTEELLQQKDGLIGLLQSYTSINMINFDDYGNYLSISYPNRINYSNINSDTRVFLQNQCGVSYDTCVSELRNNVSNQLPSLMIIYNSL